MLKVGVVVVENAVNWGGGGGTQENEDGEGDGEAGIVISIQSLLICPVI